MKRITVSLPDELVTLIDRERRRRDVSAATVIRDALEAQMGSNQVTVEGRRTLRIAALGRGSLQQSNIAENMETLLAEHARSRAGYEAMMYGTSPHISDQHVLRQDLSLDRSQTDDRDVIAETIDPLAS